MRYGTYINPYIVLYYYQVLCLVQPCTGYTFIQLAACRVYTRLTANEEGGNVLYCDVVKTMTSLGHRNFFKLHCNPMWPPSLMVCHTPKCLCSTRQSCTRNWSRSSGHSSEHKPLPHRALQVWCSPDPHRCVGSKIPCLPLHTGCKGPLGINKTQ